jgi:hypothetical protein
MAPDFFGRLGLGLAAALTPWALGNKHALKFLTVTERAGFRRLRGREVINPRTGFETIRSISWDQSDSKS